MLSISKSNLDCTTLHDAFQKSFRAIKAHTRRNANLDAFYADCGASLMTYYFPLQKLSISVYQVNNLLPSMNDDFEQLVSNEYTFNPLNKEDIDDLIESHKVKEIEISEANEAYNKYHNK